MRSEKRRSIHGRWGRLFQIAGYREEKALAPTVVRLSEGAEMRAVTDEWRDQVKGS